MTLFGFRLADLGLEPVGTPSFHDYTKLGDFLCWAEKAVHWLIVDWLMYGEGHFPDRYTQVLDAKKWSEETIRAYLWVGENVPRVNRLTDVPFSYYLTLAKLDPPEQRRWAEWARTPREDGSIPSRRDLQTAIRRAEREPVATGRAELVGRYRVIYADPPWPYERQVSPSGSHPTDHYDTMSFQDIAKLPVKAHAQKDAVLFLWGTEPHRFAVAQVIEAWGFEHKTAFVWDKVSHNFGHYVSVRHEHLLVCTRGSCTPDRHTPMLDSVQTFKKTGVHSQKPEEFRRLIERLYDGPYLELFGRHPVDGWMVLGNQFDERVVDEPGAAQIVAGQLT